MSIHVMCVCSRKACEFRVDFAVIDMQNVFLAHHSSESSLCTYHNLFMLEEEVKVSWEIEELLRFKQNVLWP